MSSLQQSETASQREEKKLPVQTFSNKKRKRTNRRVDGIQGDLVFSISRMYWLRKGINLF